ncbi:MAG: hypothetical protein JWO50_639 [Candidatus Kaiserbacteria bacterium]|nr:hypothetical protein [Candidatus Kaiserbacteria bacterium]
MDEQKIIDNFKSEGYQKIYIWDAEPGEIDEEHQHDFDTCLIILKGKINITSLIDAVVTNTAHQAGAHIFIEKNNPHSAKVGPDGCRYLVAEKH